MASFPSEAWFRGFGSSLEKDEDFLKHGRWLTAWIGFRVDQTMHALLFDRGLVMDVAPGYRETDFLISGTSDQWSYLFDRHWGLVRLYRSQTLSIRGDPVQLMQNWKPVFFIVEGMKRFAQPL